MSCFNREIEPYSMIFRSYIIESYIVRRLTIIFRHYRPFRQIMSRMAEDPWIFGTTSTPLTPYRNLAAHRRLSVQWHSRWRLLQRRFFFVPSNEITAVSVGKQLVDDEPVIYVCTSDTAGIVDIRSIYRRWWIPRCDDDKPSKWRPEETVNNFKRCVLPAENDLVRSIETVERLRCVWVVAFVYQIVAVYFGTLLKTKSWNKHLFQYC